MKVLEYFLAVLVSFALMIIFCITSIEITIGMGNGYFEKKYEAYQVTDNVQICMKDLLFVTDEMMDYLTDQRSDLIIEVEVEGQKQEFFNDIEKAHMVDVKNLFIIGIWLNRIMVVFVFICLEILFWKKKLFCFTKVFKIFFPSFLVVVGGLAALVATDFTTYFVLFHKLIFDNENWWLDPNTSRLINIVPEPFFIDTALRILLLFFIMGCSVFLLSIIVGKKQKRQIQENMNIYNREQV